MSSAPLAPITDEEKLLAAMAYGEGSTSNNLNEMKALASVLIRQRNARGYSDMHAFINGEISYSYVTSDSNVRYQKLKDSTDDAIRNDPGMANALSAARNALTNGEDLSNGAYFWDGGDIKSNYAHHFKVRHGIKFSKASDNIYNIAESTKVVILYKRVKKKVKKNGKVKTTTENIEVGRYDHVYDSTAAYGGTIFWKNNDDYIRLSKGKVYK